MNKLALETWGKETLLDISTEPNTENYCTMYIGTESQIFYML